MDTNKKVVLVAVVSMSVFFVTISGQGQGCYPIYNGTGGNLTHTMCVVYANSCQPGLTLVASGVLSAADQKIVLDYHNALRASIMKAALKNGTSTTIVAPKAIFMPNMTWDAELAMIAQRSAESCKYGHDANRQVPRFKVGQNIYLATRTPPDPILSPNMTTATAKWFNEVYIPGFPAANIKPYASKSGTGHYTQIAWENSTYLGCGYVYWRNGTVTSGKSSKYIVCNYGPAGNIIGGTMYRVDPNASG